MKPLGLKFRLDDLTSSGRPIEGELSKELLESCLPGLIGTLGYRPTGSAQVGGTVYRSAASEVIVDGIIETAVGFDCSRCLEEQTFSVSSRKSYVLVKRSPQSEGSDEITVSDDDDDGAVDTFEGDEIDLRELFRQELMLQLPMNPICETAGLTPCAEIELPDGAEADEGIDPRWAPLLEMKKNLK